MIEAAVLAALVWAGRRITEAVDGQVDDALGKALDKLRAAIAKRLGKTAVQKVDTEIAAAGALTPTTRTEIEAAVHALTTTDPEFDGELRGILDEILLLPQGAVLLAGTGYHVAGRDSYAGPGAGQQIQRAEQVFNVERVEGGLHFGVPPDPR